ncbi:hypothetical protein [Streptomyces sp. NPDC059802]|uniref:hypothetical protein n=1 Tax=Streptomyces sp. NPDC059802 TaxID=3346952 RepID=UPI00365D9956
MFAGLSLALAVPAAGHAVGGDLQIDIDYSQSGAVAIHGQDLANAGAGMWEESTTGSFTVGGAD